MRALNHRRRRRDLRPLPLPERRAQGRAFILVIRAIGLGAEGKDRLAIRLDHRRIHAVERGARHRAQDRDPFPLPLCHSRLSLVPRPPYSCTDARAGTRS